MFLSHNFHTDAVYVIIWLSWVSRFKFAQESFHSCHSCWNIFGFGANLRPNVSCKAKNISRIGVSLGRLKSSLQLDFCDILSFVCHF